MRAVLQRVSSASVSVDNQIVGEIGRGVAALVSVDAEDGEDDARLMAEKIASLRIFNDDRDKMNLSVADIGGQVLVISQFTLHGDCRRGRRPSFTGAAAPEQARHLYEAVIAVLRDSLGLHVASGVFAAHMRVALVNEGPVTILLDTHKLF